MATLFDARRHWSDVFSSNTGTGRMFRAKHAYKTLIDMTDDLDS